jgi:pilus assembly protein Flp/PilA
MMIATLRTVIRDDAGATLVEYGLLIALIALIAVAALTLFGHDLRRLFRRLANAL